MTEQKAELRQLLMDNRAQLNAALDRIAQVGWETQVQSDAEQWTALHMLRHLQDAHRGLTGQLERMLAGGETVPRDFDINRWNAGVQRKTADLPPEDARATLNASHEKLLSIVDQLQHEDFERRGWSTARQEEVSLVEFIRIIGLHEGQHAAEIAAAANA